MRISHRAAESVSAVGGDETPLRYSFREEKMKETKRGGKRTQEGTGKKGSWHGRLCRLELYARPDGTGLSPHQSARLKKKMSVSLQKGGKDTWGEGEKSVRSDLTFFQKGKCSPSSVLR